MRACNYSTNTQFRIWPSKHISKNHKFGDSYSSCILFTIPNRYTTPLLSNTPSSRSRSLSLPSHLLPSSSTPPLPILGDTRFLPPHSLNYTLPKRFSSQIQAFEKDSGKISMEITVQICRKEWQGRYMRFYEVLERQVRDQILLWPRISASSRTLPEEIHWNRRPREWAILLLREISPIPGGTTNRPLVDNERGLGRGADSEGIIKSTGTLLEVGACEAGLPASIGQQFQLVKQASCVLQW